MQCVFHWGAALKRFGAVAQPRQIKAFPHLVASVGNELLLDLNQLAQILLLMTAAGFAVLCGRGKSDLITVPPLENLLDAGQCKRRTRAVHSNGSERVPALRTTKRILPRLLRKYQLSPQVSAI